MKYFTLLLALMLPLTSYAITRAPINDTPTPPPGMVNTIELIEKLNMVAGDIAVCQGYYMFQEDADGTMRFALHGELLMELVMDFLTNAGIRVQGSENVDDVYYKNVNRAKDGMSKLDAIALSEIAQECNRLDQHLEDAKTTGL